MKPNSFKRHTIIYNDGHFSVAYGEDNHGNKRLAMRWNGAGESAGYPNQGGHPLWFQLPEYGHWTTELLATIDKMKESEKRMKGLDQQIVQS